MMYLNKFSIFATSLLLALSLCACGGGETTKAPEADPAPVQPAPEKQEEKPAAPSSKATLGDYEVEIGDAFMAKDWDGNPAIVVSYNWTNNGDSATSAMAALDAKAYQDGVQLEIAMMDAVAGYDPEAYMLEVKPGTTHTYQQAYVCTSTESGVQVEVTEFLGGDDMAQKTFDITALG